MAHLFFGRVFSWTAHAKLKRFALLLLYFPFIFQVQSASAVDLFSIKLKDQCPREGALISVTESEVVLLDLNGQQLNVAIDDISSFAQYNALQNPFPRFKLGAVPLLRVKLRGESHIFNAYATNFFENLVFFHDSDGNQSVVETSEIEKLEPFDSQQALASPKFQAVVLVPSEERQEFKSNSTKCSSSANFEKNNATRLSAIRSFSNPLAVQAFLRNMRTGYIGLTKLVERANFYARPLLLSEKSRMGLRISKDLLAEKEDLSSHSIQSSLPIYFEKAGGTPYGYQGSFSAGAQVYDSVPSLRPEFGFDTRFKAHALHAQLVGNLTSLPAGTTQYRHEISESNPSKLPDHLWVRQSFNYLTVFGADYLGYSVSLGSLYPIVAFGAKNEFREVRMGEVAPVFQIGYTAPEDWDINSTIYYFNKSASLDHGDTSQSFESDDSTGSQLNVISKQSQVRGFRMKFIQNRWNATWKPSSEIKCGASFLYSQLKYSENVVIADPDSRQITNINLNGREVNATVLGASAYTRVDFGQWIALRGEFIFQNANLKGSLGTEGKSTSQITNTLNGALGLEVLL